MLNNLIENIGSLLFFWLTPTMSRNLRRVKDHLYTGCVKRWFNSWGNGSLIEFHAEQLIGLRYISVGKHTVIEKGVQLTAFDSFQGSTYHPSISIGDFSCIRKDAHITAINGITLGNNVLLGTNVLVSDNSHGLSTLDDMNLRPELREAVSKGKVVIEDNVWIGNNVCILPGVIIGKGSIVGANAVVTHNIPPYSVAVGVPAKIIKRLR